MNGEPVRGAYVGRAVSVCLSPNPTPGAFAISDISANSLRDETYYILQKPRRYTNRNDHGERAERERKSDSARAAGQSLNYTIVGGTGAFLGARGQKGNGNSRLSSTTPMRTASITEDPAKRRQNGGGHIGVALYVVPMSPPNVLITANGPAVTHSSDFALVSATKPAAAGEILSLFATGLGPTLCQPGSRPTVPIEFTGSSQFAHCADGQREVRGGAGGSWVPRRYR